MTQRERPPLQRPCDPHDDHAWFYSDPRRVVRFRGHYVCVSNRRVVASGTASHCFTEARAAGIVSPLIVWIPTLEEQEGANLGL